MKQMTYLGLATVLAAGLTGCDVFGEISIGDDSNYAGENRETVMGSVRVGDNAQAGDLSSVNGGIDIGSNSEVGRIETVNGGIRIGSDTRLESVETVNGGITVGAGSEIEGDLTTVNGSIKLSEGVRVGGDLGNVNGAITLSGATVDGDFKAANGSLNLLDGSTVAGAMVVGERGRNWFGGKSKPVKVVIGRNSRVGGPLTFRRPVELWVHDSATVGEVEGAEVRRYSGDKPPRTD